MIRRMSCSKGRETGTRKHQPVGHIRIQTLQTRSVDHERWNQNRSMSVACWSNTCWSKDSQACRVLIESHCRVSVDHATSKERAVWFGFRRQMQQEPRKSRQRRQKHKYSMILCYGAFINVQRRDLTGQTALKVKPLYESISVQAPVSLDKTTCIKRDSLSTFDHKLDMTGRDPLFQGMVSWTSMEVYLRWAAGSRVIGMQNALCTDATHTHKTHLQGWLWESWQHERMY
jgi:hypothetical protein